MDCPADHAKRKPVSDHVGHARSTVASFESMRVMPQPVRTAQLDIDEAKWRLPSPDFSRPPHRQAVQAQPVPQFGSGRDASWANRQDSKPQPRRRDLFQVAGIRKRREDFIDGPGNPLLSPQRMKPDQLRLPPRARALQTTSGANDS